MTPTDMPEQPASAAAETKTSQAAVPEREYDRTGFYPPAGKKFRIWALLAWNVGIIVIFALIAAVINHYALG